MMKTIWIGPTKYKMKLGPNSDYRGWTNNKKAVIGLRHDMPKTMEAEVLLHEILHAAIYTFCINDWLKQNDEQHERLVTELSLAISTVLAQNPKLRSYLDKAYK